MEDYAKMRFLGGGNGIRSHFAWPKATKQKPQFQPQPQREANETILECGMFNNSIYRKTRYYGSLHRTRLTGRIKLLKKPFPYISQKLFATVLKLSPYAVANVQCRVQNVFKRVAINLQMTTRSCMCLCVCMCVCAWTLKFMQMLKCVWKWPQPFSV